MRQMRVVHHLSNTDQSNVDFVMRTDLTVSSEHMTRNKPRCSNRGSRGRHKMSPRNGRNKTGRCAHESLQKEKGILKWSVKVSRKDSRSITIRDARRERKGFSTRVAPRAMIYFVVAGAMVSFSVASRASSSLICNSDSSIVTEAVGSSRLVPSQVSYPPRR